MHLHGLFSREKIRDLLLLAKEFVHLTLQDVLIAITVSKCPLFEFFVIDCQRLSTMAASRPYYVVIDSIEKLKL